MNWRIALAPLALVTVLGGCNMAPKYVRPDLPVPAETPTGPAYTGIPHRDASLPAETAWADFFTDARLREVIGTALANNRDLRIAVANVEQARAQYRIQRADIFPTVGVGGDATFQKGGLAGGAAGGGQPVGSGRIDIYSVTAGISAWEIDLFGKLRNMSEASRQQFFATQENRDAAQTALIAEVATAWLTLAADRERLAIARQTEGAFQQTLDLTVARFEHGIASELEVRQARTSLDQARSDRAEALTLVAQDTNALNLLAGTTLDATQLPTRWPDQGVTLDRLPANLPSDVLLRRPDIAAAEHRLIAANANIGAARAAFFPSISLTGAVGTLSLGFSNLFTKGSDYWSVAPSASLPIFDAGRNAGNLSYAKATRDAMVGEYERTIQSAFRELADALARRGTIDQQLDARVSRRDNAQVAYSLSDARFREGIDPFLVTLDSQRTLYGAEKDLLATRLVREANAVELYRALGGGLK